MATLSSLCSAVEVGLADWTSGPAEVLADGDAAPVTMTVVVTHPLVRFENAADADYCNCTGNAADIDQNWTRHDFHFPVETLADNL